MPLRRAPSIVLAACVSALFVLAAPSMALAQTRTFTVRFADLDLATDAGRATLQRRINRAVEHVCGSAYHLTLAEEPGYQKCSRPALAGAMSQYAEAVAAAQDARRMAGGKASPRSVQ